MKTYEFNLILEHEPDEAAADAWYGRVDDSSLATLAGVPQISFHREAASLEAAIGSAINDVRSAGFETVRVEVSPAVVVPAG